MSRYDDLRDTLEDLHAKLPLSERERAIAATMIPWEVVDEMRGSYDERAWWGRKAVHVVKTVLMLDDNFSELYR